MVDKNKVMVKYLLSCPYLKGFNAYFNFGVAGDNNKQIITRTSDVGTNTTFVDGSEEKVFSMTLIDFKSVGYNALIDDQESEDENLSEMLEVQQIIDWINEQEQLKNYPDFGDNIDVEKISATNENPRIDGIDMSVTPNLALYSVVINVTYLDNTNVIWN